MSEQTTAPAEQTVNPTFPPALVALLTARAASATKDHAAAKAALVTALTGSNLRAERYAEALNQIAAAEGRLNIWSEAAGYATLDAGEHSPTPAQAVDHLLGQYVLNGADDTWSGRTNDARRATADGAREAFKDLQRMVAREVRVAAQA